MDNIDKKLRQLRALRKMTTLDLEKLTGISHATISQYELGKRKPKIAYISKLALALGVPPSELIDFPMVKDLMIPVAISNEMYRIPVYNTACSAGKFTEHPDACIDEYKNASSDLCPDPEAGAIRIKGDSMDPEVHDGDMVFFSQNYRIKNNDMVVVMVDALGLALKRVQFMGARERPEQYALLSANPKYPPRVVDAKEIVKMLKVIGIHRSML